MKFISFVVGFFLGTVYANYQHIKFLEEELLEKEEALTAEVKRYNELSLKMSELRNAEMSKQMAEKLGELPDNLDIFLSGKRNKEKTN